MNKLVNVFGLIIFILYSSVIFSQQYLNLDFEQITTNAEPRIWFPLDLTDQYYHVNTDSNVYFSGNRSLCIRSLLKTESPIYAINRIRSEDVIGKHVKLCGYIKTENIVEGHAELWIKNFSLNDHSLYEIEGWGPSGTTDWTQYCTELDIDSTDDRVLFGIALKCSSGTAWFDNFKIEIDGVEYSQELFVPTQNQINWIVDNAITLNSFEPSSDNSDLLPLKAMIGNTKIVALGEATHGTSEFFKMKHKIVKFLAEEMNFNVFAIEGLMPGCRIIGNYVLGGNGDPVKLLDNLYYIYDTQEVLDMILWMRKFNLSMNSNLEFWGFDMQKPFIATDSVKSFVKRTDPNNSTSLINACNKVISNYSVNNFSVMKENAEYVYNHLLSNKETYLQSRDTLEVEWAIKYAEIMVNSAELLLKYGDEQFDYRDEKMALNVEWILDHLPPDSKIVLWAHNMHISKNFFQEYGSNLNPMGSVLRSKYQDDFVSIGFGFHEGTYRASIDNTNYKSFNSFPSTTGCVEWAFHKTNIPNLYLDLSKVSQSDTNSTWLNRYLELHSMGWNYEYYQLIPHKLTDMFDIFFYIDETTAAQGNPSVTDVERFDNIANKFSLSQNYPNPFNPTTSIQYAVPQTESSQSSIGSRQFVTLKVFNILGKEIATLVNEEQKPGYYEVKWDASGFCSGVYLYRITAGNYVETKKMILLR